MATHRIVLLISDEEIDALGETLDGIDAEVNNYRDDWEPDEFPLVNLLALQTTMNALVWRIEREVLAS